MKKTTVWVLGFLLGAMSLQAQPQHSKVMDGGGTGAYKAVMTDDAQLPGFTIYRPADVQTTAKVEGPLPVVLFGNGGCSRNSLGFANFLTDIASHGYMVLAVGPWSEREEPDAADVWRIDDENHTLKISDAQGQIGRAHV